MYFTKAFVYYIIFPMYCIILSCFGSVNTTSFKYDRIAGRKCSVTFYFR